MLGDISQFVKHTLRSVTRGSSGYYKWVAFLSALVALGVLALLEQLRKGFVVTNMTDQVSWGAYIANFTFLVGAAAAAVMMVIPAYVYRESAMHKVVVIGEQVAFTAMVMCLMFVMVDIGRPDRFWHMLPVVGRFNWPLSLLAWDVIALGGYLLINGYLTLYLVYTKFHGRPPVRERYRPVVYISIVWAVGIHTITAFLYAGLGGRAHWNHSVLAPRFLASAFGSGPALMIASLSAVEHFMGLVVPERAIDRLRQIAAIAMLINLFMFMSELFTVLYAGTTEAAGLRYTLFGLHGHHGLVPYAWTALAFNVAAAVVFLVPRLHRDRRVLLGGAALSVLGVWLEKGMTFVVSGFVPTPLGAVVDYRPSLVETFVSLGIWAFGALLLTLLLKATVPIERGVRANDAALAAEPAPDIEEALA